MRDLLHPSPQNVIVQLNSDVGGVGVSRWTQTIYLVQIANAQQIKILYYTQILITLYFWVMLRAIQVFQSFERGIESLLCTPLSRLRSILVEFQEAQTFFVMATQINIITILLRRLGTFDSYNTI
jgi:hypothetical protein